MTAEAILEEFHKLDADSRLEVAFRIWDSMTTAEDALVWEHAELDPDIEKLEAGPHDVLAQLVSRVRNARRTFDLRFCADHTDIE